MSFWPSSRPPPRTDEGLIPTPNALSEVEPREGLANVSRRSPMNDHRRGIGAARLQGDHDSLLRSALELQPCRRLTLELEAEAIEARRDRVERHCPRSFDPPFKLLNRDPALRTMHAQFFGD